MTEPVTMAGARTSGRADTRGPAQGRLEVEGLSMRLGDRLVLDEVSFAVPPGRVVGLLGPNGAGKTTAMRIVFGVLSPDAGTISWNGRPATDADRRRWGYMPQERGLYPKMDVRDELVYFGRLRGLHKDEAGRRADELLALVGLTERAGERVERLSGGMQQRLQLAVTLVHEPDVLVLDEPFSGLDPVAVDSLSELIAEQAAAGRTVVFSSHQLDLVESLCETIVLIDHGQVVLEGDLRELKAASGQRILRLALDDGALAPLERLEGVAVERRDASEVLLRLDRSVDPLAVLDRARELGEVRDFGLEPPRLSGLFREAVRR